MGTEARRVARGIQERSVSTRNALLEGAGRVFSRLSYAESRLKDVADEAGVSQGSLYFHFGNKADIAQAVLKLQQERMTDALTEVLSGNECGLTRLLLLGDRLGVLISSDVIVQAGIKLASQPGTGFESTAREPYFEWVRIAKTLIERGIEDGSVSSSIDAQSAAEYVNSLFVGAQVLSELDSGWQSLAARLKNVGLYIVSSLGSDKRYEGDEAK